MANIKFQVMFEKATKKTFVYKKEWEPGVNTAVYLPKKEMLNARFSSLTPPFLEIEITEGVEEKKA